MKITQYSRQQLTRLVAQYRDNSWIGSHYFKRNQFPTKYTRGDIVLLTNTDIAHETLSGLVTKKLFERGYQIYHDMDYERLATISVAHIYNLRKSKTYPNLIGKNLNNAILYPNVNQHLIGTT